jgi:hypothetical protein
MPASQPPEHCRLVFHDSEVSSIAADGHAVVIKFSAALVHGCAGLLGATTDTGYLQSVELVCLGVESMQADAGCMGRLTNGVLTTNSQRLSAVPMPYDTVDTCALELEFTNGSRATLRASGVQLKLTDASRFIESFSC